MTHERRDSSLTAVLAAEQLGARLEELWSERAPPAPGVHILALLADVPAADRPSVTGHLLRAEWELRDRRGDVPAAADYCDRFPEHIDLLRELERTTAFDPDAIPGYRLLRELGRGGSSVVYLADEFDPAGEPYRAVALKLVRRERRAFDADHLMLENDVRIAGLFNHPNVVQVYHVGRTDGHLYFAMQYCPGGSLSERLRRCGPLPPREAAELCAQVADAVEYMHGLHVLHRDLKPGNVLLDDHGRVYVADFGLARPAPANSGPEQWPIAGTVPYMSPEQLRGVLGPQCDVYSLGATLYEALTGRPPFRGSTLAETARQILEREVVPPQQLNPEVDDELARLCLKCLEKDPANRYRTAAEVARDLRHYLETGQGPAEAGVWRWVSRTTARKVKFEHAAVWSRITLFFAVYTVAGHVAMFNLLQAGAPGWGYWAWFAIFYALGWLPVWLAFWLSRHPLDQTEWSVIVNWVGAAAADGLLFSLFCPLAGTPDPAAVARVYPAWLVLHGVMWIAEARSYWGRLYPFGVGFLLAAALTQLVVPHAPLVYAAVNGAAMLWLSVGFRAQARRVPRARESAESSKGPHPESGSPVTGG